MATATLEAGQAAGSSGTDSAGGNGGKRRKRKGKVEKPDFMVEQGHASYRPVLDDNGVVQTNKAGEPKTSYVVETKLRGAPPAEYSLDKFKPLTAACFEDEEDFLKFQLSYYDWRIGKIQSQRDEVQNLLDSYSRFSSKEERERWQAAQRTKSSFANKLAELDEESKAAILRELQAQLAQQVG